jgi:heat shock protein HslJ
MRIVWLAVGLVLAACVGTRPAGAGGGSEPLAGTAWRLEELNGQPALTSQNVPTPTLTFAADGSRASGNGGCNQFNGPYTQAGESLRFGPLASTRRACVEPAGNAQETAYLRALESTTRFSATAEQLLLYAGNQLVAQLWRGETQSPPGL